MNKIKFIVLIIAAIINTPVDAKDTYIAASDTNNLKVVPDEVIDHTFTLEQNYDAFHGDTISISSEIDYQFSGFQAQKIESKTLFFYSQVEQKNIAHTVIQIISPMKIAWGIIIAVFAYYLFFGYLILKIAARAVVAAFVPAAVATFFITSVLGMTIVSYIYTTPIFATMCLAGLGIALALSRLLSARAKAKA